MKHSIALLLLLSLSATAEVPRMDVIDLRQVPLADATRVLSEASGLNIVASVEAGKTPVSLYLADVEPRAAVEALCRSHNLWFREDEKNRILRIHTPEEYQRDLGSFQEELTQVFDLRFPNAADFGRSIRDLFGNRVRINFDTQQIYQTSQELEQRFQRFDIIDGRSQQLGFGENSSSGANGYYSGQSGSNNYNRSNSSSLNSQFGFTQDYSRSSGTGSQGQQNNLPRRLEGLSAEEVQALQTPSVGEQSEAAQRLIDQRVDIFVTVIQRLNKVIVRTSDSRAMQQIKQLLTDVDVPTPTVLLEVKILRVSLNQGYRSAVDYLFSDGTSEVGFGTGAVTAGDLSFRYASGNFSARIQLLEDKGQVRVVSTPTLLIANNEVSRLFIGEERPLNRSFSGGAVVPGATNNVVVNGSTDIEFRPVGTTLLITPNINADKTVTLRLLQENSNINTDGATVLVPSSNGFNRQTVDTVQSRTVSGTVVARDQTPVVIGGLIDTNLTNTRSQVPILGNIPVVGALFGKRQNSKTRDELILLIRPHVVDPSEGGARASRELLDANNVKFNRGLKVEDTVQQRLEKALPPPKPVEATRVPLPETKPPQQKKRTLWDRLRRNK